MKKRIILVTIIAIYFLSLVLSPIISSEESSQQGTVIEIFSSQVGINTEDEPEIPLKIGVEKVFTLNVNYQITAPILNLFFGRRFTRAILFGPGYILKLIRGTPLININLTFESPDWCDASIEPSNVQFQLARGLTGTKTATLTFSLNEDAPALVNDSININANFIGLWTIKPASSSLSINIVPEYISHIVAEAEPEFTIPPLKNYSVPINITNNGNGETAVTFEVQKPDGWNVSFNPKEIIIPTDESKQVVMKVINPPKGFENESLMVKFIPKSTNEDYTGDEKNLQGTPVSMEFLFNNDGSLKDDEDEGVVIDISLLIVILLVIIFIIIAFVFIKRRTQ